MNVEYEIETLRQELKRLREELQDRRVPPHAAQHELPGTDTVRLSVQNSGTQLNRHRTLNFSTGLTASENADNKRIDVVLADHDHTGDAGDGGKLDHGTALDGLADDDHTQYHNDTRGDARYLKLTGGAIDAGTLTTGSNILSLSAVWNAAADTFRAIYADITNTASAATSRLLDLAVGGTSKFSVDVNGLSLINATANAKMTTGLTINQGAADDEILAFKSSDVNHGYTARAETDTYAWMSKTTSVGGLLLESYLATGATSSAMSFVAYQRDNPSTTKSTAGRGIMEFYVSQLGTNAPADLVADGNCFVWRCRRGGANVTLLILDEDGDIAYDGTASSYDEHDDAAIVADLAQVLALRPQNVRRYGVEHLMSLGIVKSVDADGRPFVSHKAQQALMQGAIAQLLGRIEALEQQLINLKRRLP